MKLLTIFVSSILWIPLFAFLDLYIDSNETKRLLGLQAELYYVRNGTINTYATQFRVPIPSTLDDMKFTWKSRKLAIKVDPTNICVSNLPYTITFSGIDSDLLQAPTLTILSQGVVPLEKQSFIVVVQCVPDVTAEIDFDIVFNISLCQHPTFPPIKLLRKKICVPNSEFGRLNQEELVIIRNKLKTLNPDGLSHGTEDDFSRNHGNLLGHIDDNNNILKSRRRGAAAISRSPYASDPQPGYGRAGTNLPDGDNTNTSPGSASASATTPALANGRSFALVLVGAAVGIAIIAAAGVAVYYHHRYPHDADLRSAHKGSLSRPPGPLDRPRSDLTIATAAPGYTSCFASSSSASTSAYHPRAQGNIDTPMVRSGIVTTNGTSYFKSGDSDRLGPPRSSFSHQLHYQQIQHLKQQPVPGFVVKAAIPDNVNNFYNYHNPKHHTNHPRDSTACLKSLSIEASASQWPLSTANLHHKQQPSSSSAYTHILGSDWVQHSLSRNRQRNLELIGKNDRGDSTDKYTMISPRPLVHSTYPNELTFPLNNDVSDPPSTPLLLRRKVVAECINNYIPNGVTPSTIISSSMPKTRHHEKSIYSNTLGSCNEVSSHDNRSSQKLSTLPLPDSVKNNSLPTLSSEYYPIQHLRFGSVIVEGTFGEIRHAYFNESMRVDKSSSPEVPILVKMIKSSGSATASQVELMNQESAICAFKNLQHPNILALCGFSYMLKRDASGLNESLPVLIYPHFSQGILKLFLTRCHHSDSHFHQLSTKDFVYIGVQLLYGLQALHCNGIIHKDLATRNCFITENLVVKIGDTALSRDVFPADYCCLGDNENRPLKWMALESLFFKTFSFASDIWSFGVTLWEIVSFAETPYAEIDPFEIGVYLQHGFRLHQPDNCPDEMYSIILECLASDPEERPHITALLGALTRFLKTLDRFI